MTRLETGPVRRDDDWTGLFIRGDNALMALAPALRALIEGKASAIQKAQCEGLLTLLNSAAEGSGREPQLVTLRDPLQRIATLGEEIDV